MAKPMLTKFTSLRPVSNLNVSKPVKFFHAFLKNAEKCPNAIYRFALFAVASMWLQLTMLFTPTSHANIPS